MKSPFALFLSGLVCFIVLMTSCASLGLEFKGPEPGTVGFYDFKPVAGKVVLDQSTVRRMSAAEDKIYVYRVDTNMVVIGEKLDTSVRKPLDEVSRGVTISLDTTKRLIAFLNQVLAAYEKKDKVSGMYLDFRVLVSGAVSDKTTEKPDDVIQFRVQYQYNLMGSSESEDTAFFFGGGSVKKMTQNDVKVLVDNLMKP